MWQNESDFGSRNMVIAGRSADRPTVPAKNRFNSPVLPEQGLTFQLIVTAMRRWWILATTVGLVLAAAGSATVFLTFKEVYEASAWFRIEERTPFLAFETKDDGRSKLFFQTQIETIRSPLVLGPVIKRPEIAQMPEIATQVDKVAWLAKRIKVMSVGESELFRIVYSGGNPKTAADLVNAVSEAYFSLRDQSDAERNQKVIDTLEREKDKRAKEVLRLRDNLRSLAREISATDPFVSNLDGDRPAAHPLADLENRLISAQVESTVLEARIKAATDAHSTEDKTDGTASQKAAPPSPEGVAMREAMVEKMVEDNPDVQRQKAIIAAKRLELNEAEQKLAKGKANPYYARMADEIRREEKWLDQLRSEMKPHVRRDVDLTIAAKQAESGTTRSDRRKEELARMQMDWAASRVMERMLRERFEEQRKGIEQSSGGSMELAFKRDELAQAEKVFELIAQRTLQIQTERGAPGRISLMQAADPPSAPIESFPLRNMALVGLVGLLAPFAAAVGWERLRGRVGDTQSLEQQSPLAVLGEITSLPSRTILSHKSGRSEAGYDLRLFEESIDSLRTSLMLSDRLAGMRTLTVTSGSNHEGKTSVVAQLAISFGRATGDLLLLIDGDMRSPDIHRVFDVPLEPGLVGVLTGRCSLEEAIVTDWSKCVHVLPAGRLAQSPHKLLGNGAWTSLLEQIPPRYRFVLIDTPPVLAASEALVLAKGADAALVCAMRDVSRVDQVCEAISRLEAAGCRPVGTVLNGVPTRHYASRYGSYEYINQ